MDNNKALILDGVSVRYRTRLFFLSLLRSAAAFAFMFSSIRSFAPYSGIMESIEFLTVSLSFIYRPSEYLQAVFSHP